MRCARVLAGCAMAIILALLTTDGVLSQEKKDKEGKVKGQLPQGWSKLTLSAVQKEEIYKLQAEHKDSVDKLKQEIAKLDADLVKKRLSVLNDEQRKKLREMFGGDTPDPKDTKDSKDKAKDSKDKQ
jgi:trehalose/maltose hydrolase-like predicted phosphorylase